MSEVDSRTAGAADERQLRFQKDPWSFYPILLPPCVVKILIVTDSGGSFGQADFGLSALLGALAVPPGPWVRFDVTTANRRLDPTADLQDFRFDAHDLSGYDELWLFAVERTGGEIADAEVRAIAEFMDGGGGVFATGDHQDLGVAMCGRIPRVRSMRKWYWPAPGPNNEPVAPHVGGPDRLDTLSAGHDPGIQFDDQSDDVPQQITPRLYQSWPWNPFFHRAHPHPLLCGPRGVIRVLPDHPHEGECYVPADLSAVLTVDGYQVVEYPGGIAPEVIAWSANGAGRTSADLKGLLNPHRFGAIGALDGHRADEGRVVVDATWHHFFNINLIGELGSFDPVKGVGFAASLAGSAAYEDIKSYYRNIAVWLAREPSQNCMWWRALWWTRWQHRLVMDVRPPRPAGPAGLDVAELVTIGGEARDVLGRFAGQCTVRRWILWHVIRPYLPRLWPELLPLLDPWLPNPPIPDPPPERRDPEIVAGLHGELLLDVLFGAAVHAVAARFPVADPAARKEAESTELGDVVREHLDLAVRAFATYVGRQADVVRELGDLLAGDQR